MWFPNPQWKPSKVPCSCQTWRPGLATPLPNWLQHYGDFSVGVDARFISACRVHHFFTSMCSEIASGVYIATGDLV